MDDLDLYDDLDEFQEQQEKKSKELQEAEDKYQHSLETIQGLEDENKALKKKIQRMELSFQSLLDTARSEIKRKDKEIERLRKEKDDICFRRKFPPNRSQETESRPFQQVIRNPFASTSVTATSESQTTDQLHTPENYIVDSSVENESKDGDRHRHKEVSDRSTDSLKRHHSRENESKDRGRPREKQNPDRYTDSRKRQRSRDSHNQNYNKRQRSEEDHEHGTYRERRKDQQEHHTGNSRHEKRDDRNQSRSRYDRDRYDDQKNRDRKTTKSSESPGRCEYRRKRFERDDRTEPRQRNDRKSPERTYKCSESIDRNRHRDSADRREHNLHSTHETCNNVGNQPVLSSGSQYTSDVENKTTTKDKSFPQPTKSKDDKGEENHTSQVNSSKETEMKGNSSSSHLTVDKNCQETEKLPYENFGDLGETKEPNRDETTCSVTKKTFEKSIHKNTDTKCQDIEELLYENLTVNLEKETVTNDNSGHQELETKSKEQTANKVRITENQRDKTNTDQDIDALLYENLDCNDADDVIPKQTVPINQGSTPRKAALFDALFGPSPSSGNSSDSNPSKNLLNNIMGILAKTKADENSTTSSPGEKECNEVTQQQSFDKHEFDKCFTKNEHKPQGRGTTIDLTDDFFGNEVECMREKNVNHTEIDNENNKKIETDTEMMEGVKDPMDELDAEIDDVSGKVNTTKENCRIKFNAERTTENLANNTRKFFTSDCLSTVHIPGLDLIPNSFLFSKTTEEEERNLYTSGQEDQGTSAENLDKNLDDQTTTDEKSLYDITPPANNIPMADVNLSPLDLISPESLVLPVPEVSPSLLFEKPNDCRSSVTDTRSVAESSEAPTSLITNTLSSLTKVSASISETENCATQMTQNHEDPVFFTPRSARTIPCLNLISPEASSTVKKPDVSLYESSSSKSSESIDSSITSKKTACNGIDCVPFDGLEMRSNSSDQNYAADEGEEKKTSKSRGSLSLKSNFGAQETEGNTGLMFLTSEAQKSIDQNPAANFTTVDVSVSQSSTRDAVSSQTSGNYLLTSPKRTVPIPCLDLTSPELSSAIRRRSLSTTESVQSGETSITNVALSHLGLITHEVEDNCSAQKRIINVVEELSTIEKSQDSGLELISAEDGITPAADLKTASDPIPRTTPTTCSSLKSLDSAASTDTSEISTDDQIDRVSTAVFADLDIGTSNVHGTSSHQNRTVSVVEELKSIQIEHPNVSPPSSNMTTNEISKGKISEENVIGLDGDDNSTTDEKSGDLTAGTGRKSHEAFQENISEPEVMEIADDEDLNGSLEDIETIMDRIEEGLPRKYDAKKDSSNETCSISSVQIKSRDEVDERESNQIENPNVSQLSSKMLVNDISTGKFSEENVIELDDDDETNSEISEPKVIEIIDDKKSESQSNRGNVEEINGSSEELETIRDRKSKEVCPRNNSDSQSIEIADDDDDENEKNVNAINGSPKESFQRNILDSESIEIVDDGESETESPKKNINIKGIMDKICQADKDKAERSQERCITMSCAVNLNDNANTQHHAQNATLSNESSAYPELDDRVMKTTTSISSYKSDQSAKLLTGNDAPEIPNTESNKLSEEQQTDDSNGTTVLLQLRSNENNATKSETQNTLEDENIGDASVNSPKQDKGETKGSSNDTGGVMNSSISKPFSPRKTDEICVNSNVSQQERVVERQNACTESSSDNTSKGHLPEKNVEVLLDVDSNEIEPSMKYRGDDMNLIKQQLSPLTQKENIVLSTLENIPDSLIVKPNQVEEIISNSQTKAEPNCKRHTLLNSNETRETERIDVEEDTIVQLRAEEFYDLQKDKTKERVIIPNEPTDSEHKQDRVPGDEYTLSKCLRNSKTNSNLIPENIKETANANERLETNSINESCEGNFASSTAGEDGKDMITKTTTLSKDLVCYKESPLDNNQSLRESNCLVGQNQNVCKEIINSPTNLLQIAKSGVQINDVVEENSQVTEKTKNVSPDGCDAKQNQSQESLTPHKHVIHKHLGNNLETKTDRKGVFKINTIPINDKEIAATNTSTTSKIEPVNISNTAVQKGTTKHLNVAKELLKQDLQILCHEIIKPACALEHLQHKENVAQNNKHAETIAATSPITTIIPNTKIKLNATPTNAQQSMGNIMDNPELPKIVLISPLKAKEWVQKRIIINPNVDSSNSIKSSTLNGCHIGSKEADQRRLINNTAADTSNTHKSSTIPDTYNVPNILPSISTNCPTPSNFSGIFSKKPLDFAEDELKIKKKSPKPKACILPAASVLCTRDNLANATKSSLPTINKKLHWELLKNKNEMSEIEDDSDAESSNDGQKKPTENVEKVVETEQTTVATTMPQTSSKTLRCLEIINKTASESEETKSSKLSNLNMAKNPVNARRRNTIDTVPITHAVSYYKQLDELENFKDLTITGCKGITRPTVASATSKTVPSKTIKYRPQKPRMSKKLRAKLMASSPIRVRSAESLMDASLYKATMIKRKQICVCLHSKPRRFTTPVKMKKINARNVSKVKEQLCKKSRIQIKKALDVDDKADTEMIAGPEVNLEEGGRLNPPGMSEKLGDILSTNVSEQQVLEQGLVSTSISVVSPACPNGEKVKISTEENISHNRPQNQCTPTKELDTQGTCRGTTQKEFGKDRELEDIVQFKTPTKKNPDTNLNVIGPPKLSTEDVSDLDKNTSSELEESPAKEGDTVNTSTIYPKEHSSDEQNSSLAENSEPECNKYLKKDNEIQTKSTESPNEQIISTADPMQGEKVNEEIASATTPVATVDALKLPDKSFIVSYKIPKLKKANEENASNSGNHNKVESLEDSRHKVRPFKGHLSSYRTPKSNDDSKAKSWIIETYNAKRNTTDEAGDKDRRHKHEEKKKEINNKIEDHTLQRPEKKEAWPREQSILEITQNETLAAAFSERADVNPKALPQENARKETTKTRRKSINIARPNECTDQLQQASKLEDKTVQNVNFVPSQVINNSPQLSNSNIKARRKSLNIQRRKIDSSTDEECRKGSSLEDKTHLTKTANVASSQDNNHLTDLKSSSIKTRRKSVNIQRRIVGLSSSDDEPQTQIKENQECPITSAHWESLKSTNKESKRQIVTATKKHISTVVNNPSQTPNDSNFAEEDDVYSQFLKARSEYLRLHRQIFDTQSDGKSEKEHEHIEEQTSHNLESENPTTQAYNRVLNQKKLQENPKQSKDLQENSSKSIKRRRQSVYLQEKQKTEDAKVDIEKGVLGTSHSDQSKDEIAKVDKCLKMRRKSLHTVSKESNPDDSSTKSMGKRRKSLQVDKKTLKASDPDPFEQNMSEAKDNPTTNHQVGPVKQLRTRRKSLYVDRNSLCLEENDKIPNMDTAARNMVNEDFEVTNKSTKPTKRRGKAKNSDKDAAPISSLATQKTDNKVNNSNEGSSCRGMQDTNSSCVQATEAHHINSLKTNSDPEECKVLTQDLSKNEKALTDGDKSFYPCMNEENIKQTAGRSSKSTRPLRTRSKSTYMENPNFNTDPNEKSIILTPQEDPTEIKAIHSPVSLSQHIPNKDTGHQSDSDASTIIRNININKMRRKSLNIQRRRILDSSDDDADGTQQNPPQTVIQNVDIVAPPPARTKRSPRKRRTVKVLSASHDDIVTYKAKKTKSDSEDVKIVSSASPTFNHPIFHTQVRDEPQPNINSLTPLSHDDRFNEIDSNMQDMFRSPQREPDVTLQVPAAQDTMTTIIAAEPMHDSNANVTIDETVCSSNRENEQSSLDISKLPVLDSTLAHNQSEAKHLSLGSSEYRFEKVSDNVVNLFISRKRKRKRTN